MIEGGVASVVAGCATHPLDLIKFRMQLHGEPIPIPISAAAAFRTAFAFPSLAAASISLPHPGPISVGVHILRSEGPAAFFSGMGLYDVFKISWSTDPAGSLTLHLKIAAALVVAGIDAAVGNPADVAKVRMHADGRLPHNQRCHPPDCVAGRSSLPLAPLIADGEPRHDRDSVTAGDL